MYHLLLTVHYLVCLFLIVIILLQAGKGADIGAAFGGASQTVFGSRGPATFLNKMTTIIALVFLVTSILLAQQSRSTHVKSVIDGAATTESVQGAPGSEEQKGEPQKPAEEVPAGGEQKTAPESGEPKTN